MSPETGPLTGGRVDLIRRLARWFGAGTMVLWAGWSVVTGSIVLCAALVQMPAADAPRLIGILLFLPGLLPGAFVGHLQVHGGPLAINDNINYPVVYASTAFFYGAIAYLLLRLRRKK